MTAAKIEGWPCSALLFVYSACVIGQSVRHQGRDETTPCTLVKDESVSGDSFIQADEELTSICAESVSEEKIGSQSMIQSTPKGKRMKTVAEYDLDAGAEDEVDVLENPTAKRIHPHVDLSTHSVNNAKQASQAPAFFQTELVSNRSHAAVAEVAWWQRPVVAGGAWFLCIVLAVVLLLKSSGKDLKAESKQLFFQVEASESLKDMVSLAPSQEKIDYTGAHVYREPPQSLSNIKTDVLPGDASRKDDQSLASMQEVGSRSQSSSDVFDNFVEQIATSVIQMAEQEKETTPPVKWWAPVKGSEDTDGI